MLLIVSSTIDLHDYEGISNSIEIILSGSELVFTFKDCSFIFKI